MIRNGIYAGWIGNYNPTTKIYNVNIDGLGDKPARRLHTGIDRPYPDNTRVLCAQAHDMAWVIMGELEMPEPQLSENRPRTVDDAAAELVKNLGVVNTGVPALDTPQYRNPLDEIHFAGDVSIENRTADPRSRSRVKVYSFGSVLTFASNFCFQILNRKDNKILTNARSIITRSVGYIKSVIFKSETNKTTIHERLQSSPLEKDANGQPAAKVDRETFEGDIPAKGNRARYGSQLIDAPKVERGRRDVFGNHRVEERDNKTSSYRERQDSVTYDSTGAETARTTEIYKEEGRIVSGSGGVSHGSRIIYRDWLVIEINNDTGIVRIEDLKRDQRIEMNNQGVVIKGNTVSLEGDIIQLKASTAIKLDTPALYGTNLGTVFFETATGRPLWQLNGSGDGYFDLSMYEGIVLDNYRLAASTYDITANLRFNDMIFQLKSKLGAVKGLLSETTTAANSPGADKSAILKEVLPTSSPAK